MGSSGLTAAPADATGYRRVELAGGLTVLLAPEVAADLPAEFPSDGYRLLFAVQDRGRFWLHLDP